MSDRQLHLSPVHRISRVLPCEGNTLRETQRRRMPARPREPALGRKDRQRRDENAAGATRGYDVEAGEDGICTVQSGVVQDGRQVHAAAPP